MGDDVLGRQLGLRIPLVIVARQADVDSAAR